MEDSKRGRKGAAVLVTAAVELCEYEGKNCCYILRCSDGTLYTGWTNRIDKRLKTHQMGKGGKYTRARLPVKLVYYEIFPTKEEAMSREYAIKHMSRKEKEALLKEADSLVCVKNE